MSIEFDKNKKKAFIEALSNPILAEGFRLDSQDPNDFSFLQEFIPGIIITHWGGSCPFQCEGYFGDYPFYMRAEDGYASINVATAESTNAVGRWKKNIIYSSKIKTPPFGLRMSMNFFIEILFELYEKLDKHPMMYTFKNSQVGEFPKNADGGDVDDSIPLEEYKKLVKINKNPEGDRGESIGWGMSPLEAYLDACKPQNYSIIYSYRKNMSDEEKRESIKRLEYIDSLRIVLYETDDVDDRVFPLDVENFRVQCPEIWRNDDGSFTIQ